MNNNMGLFIKFYNEVVKIKIVFFPITIGGPYFNVFRMVFKLK